MTPEDRADALWRETAARHGMAGVWPGVEHLAATIRAAVVAEREACAMLADRVADEARADYQKAQGDAAARLHAAWRAVGAGDVAEAIRGKS